MTNPPAAIMPDADRSSRFDPDRGWRLHPQVAVRPEPFGALLYHFGTRKLSFLKNTVVLELVQSLADHADAASAMRAVGIAESDQGPYLHALAVLAASKMLVCSDAPDPEDSAQEDS